MKKSTKIIIAVLCVVIVAAAVVAVLYFKTDLFNGMKKPKNVFYEYLDKATESKDGAINFSSLMKKVGKFQNESISAKGKMTMNVELGSMISSSDAKSLIDILNNAEINYDAKIDFKNQIASANMNVKYDGDDLGTFETVLSEKEIGIKFKDIYDKYITVSLDDVLKNAKVTGTSSYSTLTTKQMNQLKSIDPEKLVEVLTIEEDDIKRISDKFKNALKDSIPEDNYSREKEKITVNGKEIDATGYTVKISDKDIVSVIKNLCNSLKDDDQTINLLIDKYNKMMELTGTRATKISSSQVKQLLEMAASNMDNVPGLTGQELKIKIYEYKNEAVRIVLSFQDNAIIFDSMKDGDTTKGEVKIKASGTEISLFKFEETKKGDGKYSSKIATDFQGMKFEITADTESTDSKEIADMTMKIEIPSTIKATINFSTEAEFTSVNIDKLTASNSIDANKISEAEKAQMQTKLLDYMEKHMSTIKSIGKKMGYEKQVEQFETQLKALKAQSTQPANGTTATTTTPATTAATLPTAAAPAVVASPAA